MRATARRIAIRCWNALAHGAVSARSLAAIPVNALFSRGSIFRAWLPGKPGIGKSAHGRKVVMLTISNLRIDPRIEREARALAASGYEVVVIGPDPRQTPDEEAGVDWGDGVSFDWVPWQAISYTMHWPGLIGQQLYERARQHKAFAYHGHDIFTAFVGLSVARVTGSHLVCDFHEWGSENVKWNAAEEQWQPYPTSWKMPMRAVERLALRRASAVITVCDSIADDMAKELGGGRRPSIIRNVPELAQEPTRQYPPLKEQLGLADDTFVLLWQGGTGPTRMIEPIIESLAYAPGCTFVIRGPSLEIYGDAYVELARKRGVDDRLVLLDAVPSRDVVAAGRGADAGIWTLPDLCKNFRYALPNKIFEYLASGLPVLVADYPEARKVAVGQKVGLTFDPYSPQSIADAINALVADHEALARMTEQTSTALGLLDANAEWEKVVKIYDGLPLSPRAAG